MAYTIDVEFEKAVVQLDPVGLDRLDRVLTQVDEMDVVSVVGLEVAVVDDDALAAERIVRHEILGGLRVVNHAPNHLGVEPRRCFVRVDVEEHVGPREAARESPFVDLRELLVPRRLADVRELAPAQNDTAPNRAVPAGDAHCAVRISAYCAFSSSSSLGPSGRFGEGSVYAADRCSTNSSAASFAITGIDCTPDEPVPTTATRLPVKS